jgi:hypothetical protein
MRDAVELIASGVGARSRQMASRPTAHGASPASSSSASRRSHDRSPSAKNSATRRDRAGRRDRSRTRAVLQMAARLAQRAGVDFSSMLA